MQVRCCFMLVSLRHISQLKPQRWLRKEGRCIQGAGGCCPPVLSCVQQQFSSRYLLLVEIWNWLPILYAFLFFIFFFIPPPLVHAIHYSCFSMVLGIVKTVNKAVHLLVWCTGLSPVCHFFHNSKSNSFCLNIWDY